MNTGSFPLSPKPPYDIKSHLESYSFGEPQPYIYSDSVWRRALRLKDGSLMPVEVEIGRDVESPALGVSIHSELADSQRQETIKKIKWIFNTEYDLLPLYEFMDSDPLLGKVRDNHYGLKPAYFPTVYEGIIVAILQQQLSLKFASHMTWLIVQKFGEFVMTDSKEFWEFPSPEKLAEAHLEDLRECKLSRRKGEYIVNLSQAAARKDFDPESLKNLSYEEILQRLTSFRGLGRWTAEMVIVTSIGHDSTSPAGDLGTRKAISRFYNKGELMPEEEVRRITEKWGKYKGIITYYLIAEHLHGRQTR